MISSRSTHYWLWFLLFGLVAAIAKGFNTETVVVGIAGLLGLLMGFGGLARFSRPYDLIVGLIFTALGLIGIVTSLRIGGQIGLSTSGNILGLSLAIPYNLIHTVLGLTSLNHSFKQSTAATTVAVATPTTANAA